MLNNLLNNGGLQVRNEWTARFPDLSSDRPNNDLKPTAIPKE